MPYTIIFYGRSGAGKGTQAKLLIEYLKKTDTGRKTLYVETGQNLRDFVSEKNNFTSRKVDEIIKEGNLLPAFLPIWAWTDFLINHYTGDENLILDGLARREDEASVLDGMFNFYLRESPIVMHIDVSREVAKMHLLGRGRADDTEEDIGRRLDWYDKDVLPTLDYFKNHPKYIYADINGNQPIEKVHEDVVEFLKKNTASA